MLIGGVVMRGGNMLIGYGDRVCSVRGVRVDVVVRTRGGTFE